MTILKREIEKALINRAKNIVRAYSFRELKRKPKKDLRCVNHKSKRADIHHLDYNDPTNVLFLCRKCHLAWHRKNKSIDIDIEGAVRLLNDNGIGTCLDPFLERFGIEDIIKNLDKTMHLISASGNMKEVFDDWRTLNEVREGIIWKSAVKHL